MMLGHRTAATAAGFVLMVTLGGCGGGRALSAGKPAAAETPSSPVPTGSWECEGPGTGPGMDTWRYVSTAVGHPTPQEAMQEFVSKRNEYQAAHGKPAITGASFLPTGDTLNGPVNFEAKNSNGALRAAVIIQRGGSNHAWLVTGIMSCGSFWDQGK